MAMMTWNSKLSVGVKSIDSQHMVLVGILNDLHDAMMKGEAKSVTGALLRKLAEYTVNHFANEESIMSRTKYPGLATHKTLHENLKKQVQEYIAKFDKGEAAINLQLLEFLRNWLGKHIQGADREYGPWLNQHGVQ